MSDNLAARIVPILFFAILFPTEGASAGEPLLFSKLEHEYAITSTEISEDRRRLFVSHEAADKISVWEIATNRLVETVACPAPRFMLARGGKLYVACYGRGTIRVFSRQGSWKLVDELLAGVREVDYLSAPQGEHFAGSLLAVGGPEGRRQAFLIEPDKDLTTRVRTNTRLGLATFSYNGNLVMDNEVPDSRRVFTAEEYLFQNAQRLQSHGDGTGFLAYQVQDIPWWFGSNAYLQGMDARHSTPRFGIAVIPDRTAARFYVARRNVLTVHRFDTAATETARLPANYPETFLARYVDEPEERITRSPGKSRWRDVRVSERGYEVLPPVAVTLDDRLYLYLTDLEAGSIYRAEIDAARLGGNELPRPETTAATPEAPLQAETALRIVATPHLVTEIAICENHRYLLVLAEEADLISVLEVSTGKTVAEIRTPKPKFAICRGDRLFVANYGLGQISIFDTDSWNLAGKISAGGKHVMYLAAPQGEHFRNEILATSADPHPQRPENFFYSVFRVELEYEKHHLLRKLYNLGEARVCYRGDYVLERDFYNYETYIRGRLPIEPEYLRETHRTAIGRRPSGGFPSTDRYQVAGDLYWFDQNYVYGGVPAMKLWPNQPNQPDYVWLAPDRNGKLVYAARQGVLSAHRLDGTLAEFGRRPLEYENGKVLSHPYRSTVPIAVAQGGLLSIFLVDGERRLLAYHGPEFSEPDSATADVPRPAEEHFAIVNQPFSAPVAASSGDGVQFDLMQGPAGGRVSPEGLIEWTPTLEQLGEHRFRVRSRLDDRIAFHRVTVNVVDADSQHVIAEAVQAGRQVGIHHLLHPHYQLQPSLDGRNMLLFEGSQVRFLDAEGLTETRTAMLPHFYRHFGERELYYVGIGADRVDLLDKSSLQVRRRIPLNSLDTNSAAFDPGRRICYIATDNNIPFAQEPWLRHRPVVVVDEAAGTVRETGLYGTWLAVDHRGRALHVVLQGKTDPDEDAPIVNAGGRTRRGSIGNWTEILGTYTFTRAAPRAWRTRPLGISRGYRLLASPDGEFLTYLSPRGYSNAEPHVVAYHQRHYIPCYPSRDVTELQALYDVGTPFVAELAFHPGGRFVAATDMEEILFFDLRTGRKLEELIDPGEQTFGNIHRLWFSAGGRHLLVDHQDSHNRRILQAFPLREIP